MGATRATNLTDQAVLPAHVQGRVGEAFLVRVVHNKRPAADDKPERTYANIKGAEGTWLVQATRLDDPIAGTSTPVPVPEAAAALKLLLWDRPSKQQLDTLFIDGTRTVKDEKGAEREVSRNWLQEDIVQNALNYEGSALEALIGGLGDPDLAPEAPETPTEAPQTAKPKGEGQEGHFCPHCGGARSTSASMRVRRIRKGSGGALPRRTLEIRAAEFTTSDVGDAPMLPELLDQIPPEQEIGSATADGAAGTRKCHDAIAARGAAAIIPPRKNAKFWKPDTAGAPRHCPRTNGGQCLDPQRNPAHIKACRPDHLATMERVSPPKLR